VGANPSAFSFQEPTRIRDGMEVWRAMIEMPTRHARNMLIVTQKTNSSLKLRQNCVKIYDVIFGGVKARSE
jgi:hypothetical protein